jgi:hypothetical protein
VCILWDISDIEAPELLKTFHLSPVSRSKNPAQSYLKDLGDLDSETILFLNPEVSPTGRAGFVFGGAISGTLSFYEFQCRSDTTTGSGSTNENVGASSQGSAAGDGGNDGLSGGAIAGIVIAGVVALGAVAFMIVRSKNEKEAIPESKGAGGVEMA